MATAKRDNTSATGKRSILLVDDHPVLREGLAKLIEAEEDLSVCGQAQTPAEALTAIQQLRPDAVVVDLALREGHGLELIKDIRVADRRLPILVFTIFDEPSYAMRALRAGAQGYLTKQETSEQLVAGLRSVLKGDYALSPRFSQLILGSKFNASADSESAVTALGDRELEVFELLGNGLGTTQIAQKLGRSIKTIETYRARIKRKLKVTSSNQLVREAVRWVENRQTS